LLIEGREEISREHLREPAARLQEARVLAEAGLWIKMALIIPLAARMEIEATGAC
jgi:hypothetical protein